jgi:hypothetical protein
MKAKTKRRVIHVLTKKKLVKKKLSRHILRSFLIGLATISVGSLAYAITLNKPTISVPVHGTDLNVKNLRTGRSVICRVNDYGPEAWTGRIIDLSRGSFREIDSLSAGTAPVELRVAAGPTGFQYQVENDVLAAVVGYNLCHNTHTPDYCDAHRQD